MMDKVEDCDYNSSRNGKRKRSSSSRKLMPKDMDSISRALSIPHVLVRIVKYLPARDIINFRRVCKLWNEYSDLKFVFRKFDLQPQEIDVLLRKTDCRRLNLEFQDCDLNYISDEMWRTSGPKLRSLCLYGCITKIGTLQSIISNCIGLEILEIVLVRDVESDLLERLMDYFVEREKQHTRLRTLSINGQTLIKISQFLKILTVFPYIKDLCCDIEKHDSVEKYTFSESHGTYDMQKLKSYRHMVNKNDDLLSERPVALILDYPLFRMTTFRTTVQFRYIIENAKMKEQLFNFFTIQKDLKVIHLRIIRKHCLSERILDDAFGIFIKSLLFHILKSCSNLREFCLRQEPVPFEFVSLKLTSEETMEFFSLISGLQCLKIPFIIETDIPESTAVPFLLPNISSLCVLQLNAKDADFFSIVKLCPQLKHLNIDVYSDQQLRGIITEMPNLEILILRLRGCTNYGFTGLNRKSPIQKLRKLEYLHITVCEGNISMNRVFDKLCFPRLEYLGLCLEHRINLPTTLLNMPALRTLEVYLFGLNVLWEPKHITELCKFLGNLEHLIIDNLGMEREISYPKKLDIFNSLSKLRFMSCYGDQDILIFDRPSGKTSSSETRKLQFWEDKFYDKFDRLSDCSKIMSRLMDYMSCLIGY